MRSGESPKFGAGRREQRVAGRPMLWRLHAFDQSIDVAAQLRQCIWHLRLDASGACFRFFSLHLLETENRYFLYVSRLKSWLNERRRLEITMRVS